MAKYQTVLTFTTPLGVLRRDRHWRTSTLRGYLIRMLHAKQHAAAPVVARLPRQVALYNVAFDPEIVPIVADQVTFTIETIDDSISEVALRDLLNMGEHIGVNLMADGSDMGRFTYQLTRLDTDWWL